jgi:internalin A
MLEIPGLFLAVSGRCQCSAARADDAEDKAVAFVKRLGGTVTRDENAPGKPDTEVTFIYWSTVTEAGLKKLTPLKKLTTLNLSNTKVTEAGLKELAPFKNFTKLNLIGTQVTDAGLKELREALPKCEISR